MATVTAFKVIVALLVEISIFAFLARICRQKERSEHFLSDGERVIKGKKWAIYGSEYISKEEEL